MKYVVLVSHGEFANGLKNALSMLAGNKPEIISAGLKDGMDADAFAKELLDKLDVINQDDEVILLGDLVGGSPLTTAMDVLNQKEMLNSTVVIGGMNLPLALTTVLMKDAFDNDALVKQILSEAHEGLKQVFITTDEENNMSVSFIRIDDRMIHGQTCTRWAREYPCNGLIAVNDKAASNDVLQAAYKAASGKKTFVWTLDAFEKKSQKVLDSDTQYFLITKNSIDMCKILVDQGFKCGIDTVIVGPCNDREGAVKLGNNQSITQEEADAFEKIAQAGYKIKFALLPDVSIGTWDDFKSKFGY